MSYAYVDSVIPSNAGWSVQVYFQPARRDRHLVSTRPSIHHMTFFLFWPYDQQFGLQHICLRDSSLCHPSQGQFSLRLNCHHPLTRSSAAFSILHIDCSSLFLFLGMAHQRFQRTPARLYLHRRGPVSQKYGTFQQFCRRLNYVFDVALVLFKALGSELMSDAALQVVWLGFQTLPRKFLCSLPLAQICRFFVKFYFAQDAYDASESIELLKIERTSVKFVGA